MAKDNVRKGREYEKRAGWYLEQEGLKILEYNYRCALGEIDIVAREEETLVFCEVKYRTDTRKGTPLEAVDSRKQRRLFLSAMHYMMKAGLTEVPCRFDVIGIMNDEICLVKNAFEAY